VNLSMWAGYELWNERLRCLAPGWKLRRADDPGIAITDYGVSVSRMKRRPCPRGLSPLANFGILFSRDAALEIPPRLGSLSTVMSPPIIWQKRLLIASPRPVPPYLRVVEASAWENSWNSLPT